MTEISARYLGFHWPDGSVTLIWKWEGQLTSEHYSTDTWALTEPEITWIDLADIAEPVSDPGPKGAAVECSTERSRAPDRQPVAPVEGRAWETPATRTV